MTPEERRRFFDRLPADRREALQKRLDNFNNLSPEIKQRLREEYEEFEKLPLAKQDALRQCFRRMNQLSEDRRPIVRRELMRLRNMPPERRAKRMENPMFKSLMSDSERQLLADFLQAMEPDQPTPTN